MKRNTGKAANTFLENLQKTFNSAKLKNGAKERYFKIGPHTVRMQFAGIVLASKMTCALEHLAVAPVKNPALNVFLWDDATTNTIMSPFPWEGHSNKKQFSIANMLNTETLYTAHNEFKNILDVYDATSQTAFFWMSDARKVPSSELCSPLRNILHKFLMPQGAYLVHAGAVGTPHGGILLAGKGGTGKSTSTLGCLDSELLYAADDYTLVSAGAMPMAYSLYSSAKLHRDNIWRVPHVIPSVVNTPNLKHEKTIMFLNQIWPEKLIRQFPLRAIFLPHVTGSLDTSLTPATTKDAIGELILSTVLQFPQTDPYTVQKLIKLIRSIPAYHLKLGTQMEQIPQLILKFLRES